MKDIAVYGAGGFGREVACLINKINEVQQTWNFIGFFDDDANLKGNMILHFGHCLGGIDELNDYPGELAVALAFGSPTVTKKVHDKISNPKVYFPNLMSPDVRFSDPESFSMGIGNIIHWGCCINSNFKMGDFNVMVGADCFGHDDRIGSFNTFMPQVIISGETNIGDLNFFGVRSTLIQQMNVGSNVRIGAGAVVLTDPQDGGTYIGVPAKIVGERHTQKQPEQCCSIHDGEVLKLVAGVLNVPESEISMNSSMSDVNGWDSVRNLMIVQALEKHFGITVPNDDMFELTSVSALAAEVSKLLPAGTNVLKTAEYDAHKYAYSPLIQNVYRNSVQNPSKVALIADGEKTTYGELWTNIRKAASFILSKGYKKGDRIPIKGTKDAKFVWMYFGAHIVGVINELFDPELDADTIEYSPEEVLAMSPYEGESIDSKETDVIEILHTTGTTSKPKSVCLSHFNVYWAAKNTSDFVQNDADDVEMLVMPICHAFGIRRMVLTIMNGATAVMIPNFANVQLLVETIEKYRVTTWGMAPSAWQYVRKISGKRIGKFAGQIRHIEFGTAAMPLAGKQDILELLPNTRICHNYGLTESNRSCMIEYHDTEHLKSVGQPIADNMKVRIIDGEICVRGNQTMVGYLDEEDNATAFVDGFFRTGDCGYISDDGYIYLTGRAKEMINAGGKKVSPIEVEDAITSLGVGDCIVVGVPHDLLGECIKAYILKGSTELSLDEIDEKMKNTVPFFKCPTYYEWIDEIPVNSLGKKQRRALTENK